MVYVSGLNQSKKKIYNQDEIFELILHKQIMIKILQ